MIFIGFLFNIVGFITRIKLTNHNDIGFSNNE